MYFVILYTFNASCGYAEAEQQKIFSDHIRYIAGIHADHKVLLSGPFTDVNGGMVIIEVDSREEAEEITANDPALNSSLYTGVIHEWQIAFKRS
ncbi:MAG: hypothetical protein JXD19_03005 [Deltaproteobacteria bacterium]|nr:hypothetical protein [Deltaproteobacteria bacterium]